MRRLILLLFLFALPASATQYYVRTGGNAACTGTTDADGSSGACAFASPSSCISAMGTSDDCTIHTGTYMGVPPTGRTVNVSGAAFIKHRDGKILEEHTVWDPRELLSAMKIVHLGAGK